MKHVLLTATAAIALPLAAQASPISTAEVISVQQELSFGPAPAPITVEKDDATANNGTASVEVVPFAFAPDFVPLSATQNADGTSEVRAETTEQANTELNTAIATFTQEETNTFGMDRDYTLDFSLTGMSARINHASDTGLFSGFGGPVFDNPFGDDFEALIFSNYTAASFQYLIAVNGTNVYSARADALVNEAGGVTENVTGFTTSLTGTPGGFGAWTFGVDDLSGLIDLGTFADGETISVTSTLIAQSYATNIQDELRNTVSSRSTDPIALSSTGFLMSTPSDPTTPVPLPAAGWMLLAAVGGLAAAKRRKAA